MTKRIHLIRYTPEMESRWDEFVSHSINGTMLSTMRFLSYHPPERFRDHSLIATQGDRWVAALPAVERSLNGRRELNSHPGCTYGGLIAAPFTRTEILQSIVESITGYARTNSLDRIVVAPPPDLYHRFPCHHIDFVFEKEGFHYRTIGLSTCVPLAEDAESDLYKRMSPNCRWGIGKAQREGVEVGKTEDYEAFWEILADSLRAHGVSPVHTVPEIRLLQSRFPDRIHLFGAFHDGKMIAGSVIFNPTDTVAHTQYLASRAEYQRQQPLNLLIWNIMKWMKERGFRFLNFGVSTESEGETVNWGLLQFKESFGGTGVIHTRYTLELTEQ